MEFLQIDVLVYEIKNNGSGGNKMAETENSKDLISVLWSGADILRSKMDANEYKDYLLGIVFYKYLSDSFLITFVPPVSLRSTSLHQAAA